MKAFNRIFWAFLALVSLSGVASATSWTKTDQITSSSGGAVDFPAGFTTQEGGVWSTGSATLTPVAGTNVTGVSASAVNYTQAGTVVHAFGDLAASTTAAGGTSSVVQIPLPVSRTGGNFTVTGGAVGRCGPNVASASGVVVASIGGVTATCTYPSSATTTTKVGFSFDYLLTGG